MRLPKLLKPFQPLLTPMRPNERFHPGFWTYVFGLILGEAAFLTLIGIALAIAALYLGMLVGRPWLESRLGLFIVVGWPSAYEFTLMGVVAGAGVLIGLVPAWRIYRHTLADGMTVRI